MATIVKRHGHRERFDERKVYGSVYAACASAHYRERQCENLAADVSKKIKTFLRGKATISSNVLRKNLNYDLVELRFWVKAALIY